MDKLHPDDAFELGNQFRDTAMALGDWRIGNRAILTKAQWDELDEQEIRLLNMASRIYTCAIDLVLIATEGDKAIDVFHITKSGAKLTAVDQRALTGHLQHMLEEDE